MGANRKLQIEIDRVMKKVQEGVESFDNIWNKLYEADNGPQKEKYESDLKKEIKKLQRYRDQLKTWMQSGDIKDKKPLIDSRKLIEREMERFKVCEKETKTKAFSKEGLGLIPKADPREKAKGDSREWLNSMVSEFLAQIDTFEAEMEGLQVKKGRQRPSRLVHLDESVARHKAHINKLEMILRLLENDELSPDQVSEIKELIEDYLERNQEDFEQFEDIDSLYESLPMEKLEALENMEAVPPVPISVKGADKEKKQHFRAPAASMQSIAEDEEDAHSSPPNFPAAKPPQKPVPAAPIPPAPSAAPSMRPAPPRFQEAPATGPAARRNPAQIPAKLPTLPPAVKPPLDLHTPLRDVVAGKQPLAPSMVPVPPPLPAPIAPQVRGPIGRAPAPPRAPATLPNVPPRSPRAAAPPPPKASLLSAVPPFVPPFAVTPGTVGAPVGTTVGTGVGTAAGGLNVGLGTAENVDLKQQKVFQAMGVGNQWRPGVLSASVFQKANSGAVNYGSGAAAASETYPSSAELPGAPVIPQQRGVYIPEGKPEYLNKYSAANVEKPVVKVQAPPAANPSLPAGSSTVSYESQYGRGLIASTQANPIEASSVVKPAQQGLKPAADKPAAVEEQLAGDSATAGGSDEKEFLSGASSVSLKYGIAAGPPSAVEQQADGYLPEPSLAYPGYPQRDPTQEAEMLANREKRNRELFAVYSAKEFINKKFTPAGKTFPRQPIHFNKGYPYQKFSDELLFFIFYYQRNPGPAADILSKRGWVYNSENKLWLRFNRTLPANEQIALASYFDTVQWKEAAVNPAAYERKNF